MQQLSSTPMPRAGGVVRCLTDAHIVAASCACHHYYRAFGVEIALQPAVTSALQPAVTSALQRRAEPDDEAVDALRRRMLDAFRASLL